MREILFRGKRIDNNKWAYGNLIIDENRRYFILSGKHSTKIIRKLIRKKYYYDKINILRRVEVVPETVRQYTEIQDIWGGDIVIDKLTNIKYLVEWKIGSFWLYPLDSEHEVLLLSDRMVSASKIGNKWDNPELLKK